MEDILYIDNHSNPSYIEIGTIDFVDGLRECTLMIYNYDYIIPHIHIFNKDHSFEVCIRIFENMYYSHDVKYTKTLNKNQCKQLNKYLKLYHDNFFNFNMSHWNFIVTIWSSFLNYTYEYPHIVYEQPDYSSMKDFKNII